MAIFLIILFVLCVILLLPLRVKAHFGDGKWGVAVYYFCFRLWHRESPPEAPPDPPQNDTGSDSTEPAQDSPSEPEADDTPPDGQEESPPESSGQSSGDTSAEDTPPDAPADKPEEESPAPDDITGEDDAAEESEQPDQPKKGIKGYIARLKPHSVSDALALAKDAFASINPALRFLLRHFHFRHQKLFLSVGTDDAAKTALLYGRICAAAFPLYGQLQCLFDIEADEFRILADFSGDSITFRTSLELRVSPAVLILTVLILGVRFLWRTWRRFRREDREQKQYEEESKPLTDAA